MRWESSGVVGFDLGPLLEGQMRTAKLKGAYNSLIIGPRGFGALSLRWIQFASVFRCARCSLCCIMCYVFNKTLFATSLLCVFTFLVMPAHMLTILLSFNIICVTVCCQGSEAAIETQLVSRMCCYELVEVMFVRLSRDDVCSKNSQINAAYCGHKAASGKEMAQTVTK